ncbi:hypothetical protein [Amphritea japonica]|uniref:Uncharacterized protein n=1 Tax=Amphritea japonica ATCC BAA-1530 TaxID=1278309 RepID=A0A7R6PJY0_9GAMM|nr:hypothetical protein [Amphritea japonica]BBB24868.1 hypothetical protein AMJAP_0269 [Amphritea japonica ATCC BAA-1530]
MNNKQCSSFTVFSVSLIALVITASLIMPDYLGNFIGGDFIFLLGIMYMLYVGWWVGIFMLVIALVTESGRLKTVCGSLAAIHGAGYLFIAVFFFLAISTVSLPGIL